MNITLIAAIGKNNELGHRNELLWKIPEDMQYFKEHTIGKPCVMGIKTFQSLPHMLPNREHLILTHQSLENNEWIKTFDSLDKMLEHISLLDKEIMVIGGAKVYSEFIQYANKMLLTEIDCEKEADVYFPQIDDLAWEKNIDSKHNYEETNYKHTTYIRRRTVNGKR